MRVSKYREVIDHLFRLHNCDRHACVSSREAESHVHSVRRVLDELINAHQIVKRAKKDDKDRAERVMTIVGEWLRSESDQWVETRSDRHAEFSANQRKRESV